MKRRVRGGNDRTILNRDQRDNFGKLWLFHESTCHTHHMLHLAETAENTLKLIEYLLISRELQGRSDYSFVERGIGGRGNSGHIDARIGHNCRDIPKQAR